MPELLPVLPVLPDVLEAPVVSVEAAASVPLWCLLWCLLWCFLVVVVVVVVSVCPEVELLPEPIVPELPVLDWSLCGMLELELAPVEGVVEPALAPVDPELL